MRKYLGSKITVFSAVVAPLFVFGPLLFAFFALSAEISPATVFLALGCLACAIVWGFFIKSIRNQLYSWGSFQCSNVKIKTVFSKSSTMLYEKCKSCGIGYYTHGILNTKAGTKIFFIFLSYDGFDESFRSNINRWKPSATGIKVEFDKKLYDYLLTVFPKKQSTMLRKDYEKYLEKR